MKVIEPSIIVHGGAGGRKDKDLAKRETNMRAVEKELRNAIEEGIRKLKNGSSLDSVEAAVRYMEECGIFNAGRGAVLTLDGRIQLDAAIMCGKGLRAGAVGASSCTYNAISLARAVMERTNHILIVGDGCKALAKEVGIDVVELKASQSRINKYEEMKRQISGNYSGGTVGAVAIDSSGIPSAAVSTGGLWLKLAGRVGDSAVIGAGIYADLESGAACATGVGEEIMRNLLSWNACVMMKKMDAMEAAKESINFITRRSGKNTAGIITIDLSGNVGYAHNTQVMHVAYLDRKRDRIVIPSHI